MKYWKLRGPSSGFYIIIIIIIIIVIIIIIIIIIINYFGYNYLLVYLVQVAEEVSLSH